MHTTHTCTRHPKNRELGFIGDDKSTNPTNHKSPLGSLSALARLDDFRGLNHTYLADLGIGC